MSADNQAPRPGASRLAAGRRTALLLLLGLGAALLSGAAPARAGERPPSGLPALAELALQGAATAGLVVDLERGRVLAARTPDRALIPASTVKLATASLALETWGPDHRFATALLRRGALLDGVLQGDLVLRGGGDPGLVDADFWRLALDLAQHGLVRVAGDLVVDEGLFGRLGCGVDDRCEAETASRHAYDAPLSATPVNFNAQALTVLGGTRAGEAARLIAQPFPLPGIAVEGAVATAERPARLALERVSGEGVERLLVSGSLPPGEARTLYRSLGAPALRAGRLFRGFLERAGIAVAGQVRVAWRPVESAVPLLEHRGEPLARTVWLMLTWSNNLVADVLTLGLQRAQEPGASPSLPAAAALPAAHLVEAGRGSAFPAPAGAPAPLLFDGSGLDPANRLTARHLVQLLERAWGRTATFPSLLGALTVPAHGPQRSLPAPPGSPAAADWDRAIMVKTGGLGEPVSVTGLAGYFRFRDGGWGAFAFLVNGAPGTPLSRSAAFSAMRRDLARHWLR